MATGDDVLAQLLFGNSQKPLIEASDPYLGFQNEVANPIAKAVLGAQGPGVKTSDKIIGSLLTGLFSGAAEGFSNDYQERATNTYRNTLMGIPIGEALKGSPNIERPDILSPDVFSTLKDQAGMFAVIKNAEQQDLKAKGEQEKELENLRAKNRLSEEIVKNIMANPWQAEQSMPLLRKLLEEEGGAEATSTSPTIPTTSNDMFFAPGGAPAEIPPAAATATPRSVEGNMLDEIRTEAQKLMRGGALPAQAWTTAREAFDAKNKELDRSYKRVEEAEVAGDNLINLADKAQYALQRAGNTGFGGEIAQFGAGVLGLVNQSQADKYAAGQEINSLRTEAIGMAGKVFKGPMSDRDVKILLQSGISNSTDEKTNQEIVDRWRYAGQLQRQYTDFMRDKRALGIPVAEADKQWSEVKRANPYLLKDQNGKLTPNPYWRGEEATTAGEEESAPQALAAQITQGGGSGGGGSGGGGISPMRVLGQMIGGQAGAEIMGNPALRQEALNVVGEFAGGVTRLPETVGNMFSADTYKQMFATPEQSARSVGQMGAMTAGAVKGGTAGGMIGGPVGAAIGAGIGAGVAYLGFNSAEEALSEAVGVGTDKPIFPGLKEIKEAARVGGDVAALGGVGKTVTKLSSSVAPVFKKIAQKTGAKVSSIKEDLVGIKPRDVQKVLDKGKVKYVDEMGTELPVKNAVEYQTALEKSIQFLDDDKVFDNFTNDPKVNKLVFDKAKSQANANLAATKKAGAAALNAVYEKLNPIQAKEWPLRRQGPRNPELKFDRNGYPVQANYQAAKNGDLYHKGLRGGFNPDFSAAKKLVSKAEVKHQPQLKKWLVNELTAWEKSSKSWQQLQKFKRRIGDQTDWVGAPKVEKLWNTMKQELYHALSKEQTIAFNNAMKIVSPEKVGAFSAANARYSAYKNLASMINYKASHGTMTIGGIAREAGIGAGTGASIGFLMGGGAGAATGAAIGLVGKPLAKAFPKTTLSIANKVAGLAKIPAGATGSVNDILAGLANQIPEGVTEGAGAVTKSIGAIDTSQKKNEKLAMPTDQTVNLVKQLEGKKLKAYNDTGGVKTIGYGHTGSGVEKGVITEKEAEELLRQDLSEAENAVLSSVKVDLTPNQLTALTSFVYNIGEGAFKESTLLEKLNSGDYEGAAKEFNKWVHDNGKRVQGLVNRREIEKRLFLRV